jgi:hypothetical protein
MVPAGGFRAKTSKLGIAQQFIRKPDIKVTARPHHKGAASARATLRGVGFEPATVHLPARLP